MTMPDPRAFARECLKLYRDTLLHDVVPFWMRRGMEREHGGVSNVIDDAGNRLSHGK